MNVHELIIDYVIICECREVLNLTDFVALWIAADDIAQDAPFVMDEKTEVCWYLTGGCLPGPSGGVCSPRLVQHVRENGQVRGRDSCVFSLSFDMRRKASPKRWRAHGSFRVAHVSVTSRLVR